MDMDVQVRDFLKCRLANRVPQTHALIGKCTANSACDARHHGHECGARGVIELAHVVQVLPGNDERVARVELP